MDERTEIQREVLVEGASKRSIHRDYGIGHQPLAKILANAEPPGYQMAEERRKPVLGPVWPPSSRSWPMTKRPRPSNATRPIGSSIACATGMASPAAIPRPNGANSAKAYSKETFVPPSHPPGHAQFDFGEASPPIRASAPRPSRPPKSPALSSSGRCRCGSPMTTPPSRSPRSWPKSAS